MKRYESADPSAVIGAMGDSIAFERIVGGFRLMDGTIVVADQGSSCIRFFDANGGFKGLVGGPGAGPGEFQFIRTVSIVHGDTVAVFDPTLGRFTLLSKRSSRKNLSSFHVPLELGLYWMLPTGQLLRQGFDVAKSIRPDGIWRDTVSLLLMDRSGGGRVVLRGLPGNESIWLSGYGLVRPFGGRFLFAASASFIYGGDGIADIEMVDYSGMLKARLSIRRRRLRVTDADYERAATAVTSGTDRQVRDKIKRTLDKYPHPDSTPAYQKLKVDREGRLWVRLFAPPWATSQEWWVVGQRGTAWASVRLPAAANVLDPGLDAVLVMLRDSLGVERVALLPLRELSNGQ